MMSLINQKERTAMEKLYGNAVVGQSGGPTAAINATLAGVIRGALTAAERGEIGKLYGVIFIETSNNKIYADAAASSTLDVDTAFVFGDEAYATVDLGDAGANAHVIVKPAGSAGTADPLNQASTLGWKVDGMKSLILNNDWLVRVESATAA